MLRKTVAGLGWKLGDQLEVTSAVLERDDGNLDQVVAARIVKNGWALDIYIFKIESA